MYPKMKNLIIYSIVIAVTTGLLMAAQEHKDTVKLLAAQKYKDTFLLEAMPKATKGFPLILKVTVLGPQRVDQLSIKSNDLPVTVNLKSKTDGKEYIIKSARSKMDAVNDQGAHFDATNSVYPPIDIPEGEIYSMIFDLWSLSPAPGTDVFLYNVPAGKYTVSVKLASRYPLTSFDPNSISESDLKNFMEFFKGINLSELPQGLLKSNSIDMELLEPNEREIQFIRKMKKYSLEILKDYVNWTRILYYTDIISNDDMSTLSDVSREQISYYKLITDVNISDKKARDKSIKDVNDAKIPKFFEPEKQLLLLELKGNPAAEKEKVLKQYPDLKWRADELSSMNLGYGGGFLRSRPQRIGQASQKPETPK
jgi:hypothetical protein